MKMKQKNYSGRIATLVLGVIFIACSGNVFSQVSQQKSNTAVKLEFKGITFQPGYRIQTRYAYYESTHTNDIMVRRVRLKAKGNAFGIANYFVEIKFDNNGQVGKTPKPIVENAWLEFKLHKNVYMRVGRYDVPFTRSLLTSDSKLMLMNRSIVTGKLAKLGLVDNTEGVLLHGRPLNGHLEYSFGIFNNEVFEKANGQTAKWSKLLMPAGRLALNFFDKNGKPKSSGYADYKASYIGKGKRLSIGVNAVSLHNVHDDTLQYNLTAFGTDLFANYNAFTFEAEYDMFKRNVNSNGWYAQVAYLLPFEIGKKLKIEPNFRYQEFNKNNSISGEKINATSVGLNFYIRGHNLKAQMDYTIYGEETNELNNNVFEVQLQFDF